MCTHWSPRRRGVSWVCPNHHLKESGGGHHGHPGVNLLLVPRVWRQEFRESQVVRPERASLSFAFLPYLPPLWRVAGPRSESSIGGPDIICLLFHLLTFLARGPSGPACHCLSALFTLVIACGPSSERALCRRPSSHLPFVSFAHLYGARPEWASLSFALLFNLPPFWRTARAGQLINALLLFIEHSPYRASLSFARPDRASLSFALMPVAAPSDPCEKRSIGGGTPYYSVKGCSLPRTKGNCYGGDCCWLYTRALPPNVHALRT